MLLGSYFDAAQFHREEKIVYVRFGTPFRVASTCQACGGMRDDLEVVFNHQCCEAHGHYSSLLEDAFCRPREYHRAICQRYGFDPDRSAALGTAANMNTLAVAEEQHRDLSVVALVTGGVVTNAARAGDPGGWYEVDGRFEPAGNEATIPHGTINHLVLVNQELTPGATVRAVITATEAKTAVLQELGVPSTQSDGLATGTGTDQIAVASRIGGGAALTYAGGHSKLGELIAVASSRAIRSALAMQNCLTPIRQCSVISQLARFGMTQIGLADQVKAHLSAERAELFSRNVIAIERDPATVAAVAACTHVRDQRVWGILPEECSRELLASQGALIAAAVSGKHERLPQYRQTLGPLLGPLSLDVAMLTVRAMALGFADKWEHLEAEPTRKG
jgi:adenosylcobinamide amidohydrolase